MWTDLIEAKYDRGQKPSRDDFDKLLGHCQVSPSPGKRKYLTGSIILLTTVI